MALSAQGRTHATTMTTPSTTPYRSNGPSLYVSVSVGHGAFAVQLPTLAAPPLHAAIPDKSMAFDFLLNQLRSHQSTLPVTDLTTCLSNHFGVNHSIAYAETQAVILAIQSSIFHCRNLTGVRFLDHMGATVLRVSDDTSARPDSLSYFVFDATIGPGLTDNRLAALSTFNVRFALPLPQHDRAAIDPTMPPPDDATAHTPPATIEELLASAIAASVNADDDEYFDASTSLSHLREQLDSVLQTTPAARRLFHSTSVPGTFTTVSPKMSRVLNYDYSPGTLPTYLGSLSFLDDQATFDGTFPNPTPLEEDGSPSDRSSPTSVSSRIKQFLDLCEFDLFASILRLDYVGTTSSTDPASIRQILERLRRLRTVFQSNGQVRHCSVDDLFGKYCAEIPILPEDTNLWGFTLTNLFWDAMPTDVQDRLSEENSGYKLPVLSTLTTKTIQMSELRTLRTFAVKAWQDTQLHDKRLTRMMTDIIRKQSSPNTASVHALTSAAESVMSQYSSLPPPNPSPPVLPADQTPFVPLSHAPLTADQDPNVIIDPYTGYVSPHPRDFHGCLGCGDSIHQYKDCPMNKTEPTHTLFTLNFLARYPERRRYPPRSSEITALVTIPAPDLASAPATAPSILRQSSPTGLGRGTRATLPAWITRKSPYGPTPTADSSKKRVRLATITVKLLQHTASPSPRPKPFPIRVDNQLPTITIDLGTTTSCPVSLDCLYDTCAAVSTGNLTFHRWIITTYPELVHSYEEFDDAHPFEAIKLVGAISDPANFTEEAHGKLTAIVRYHMPYTDRESSPTALCIALGADVAVNTILGWPTITDFHIALRLDPPCQFFSSVLDQPFDYSRCEATSGLPPGVEFDPELDFVRPLQPVFDVNSDTKQPSSSVQFVEPALPATSTPAPPPRSAPATSALRSPSRSVPLGEPAPPARIPTAPSHRSASPDISVSHPSSPRQFVEPNLPAESYPPQPRRATTDLIVSLPSSSQPFNASQQMRDMCRQMNAHLASIESASLPVPHPPS